MRSPDLAPEDEALVARCRAESVRLLERNLTPDGIAAATPGTRSRARGYGAIFGRDAAVCALGMAISGDPALERAAASGLGTLAAYQAPNGQIPKFVDTQRAEADFWYLGCIDATLWWLAGVALLDRLRPEGHLREQWQRQVDRAVQWLACQEHQRFFLLQQNEASDWADIMPRSGFVLYSNALWHLVKCLYGLPQADETRRNANQLFHPFSAALAEYRRARLLAHYVRRRARNRDLYLSFVNFASFGDEGDVFGNVLAILCGLADDAAAHRVLRALERAQVNHPYPVRTVCDPITPASPLWRPYMSRHRQNLAMAVPQRRRMAVRRRVLGGGARHGRAPRGRAARSRRTRAGERAARMAVQRMAARPHARAGRHARPVVERRGVPDRVRRARAKPALPVGPQSTTRRFSTDLTPSTDRATWAASSTCFLSETVPFSTTLP